MFNDEWLQDFMSNFYGYGNYRGSYWFVGMEEGGGDSFEEMTKRLALWDSQGRRELEDVVDYHVALGITHPFAAKPKLQPTWSRLIRLQLSIEGDQPTTDQIRAYQQRSWARSDGDVCLLELLPLPSPSTRHWLYAQHSRLPSLKSRELYRQIWSSLRVQGLKQRIKEYQPKVVVFYSFSYLPYWCEVVGADMRAVLSDAAYAHRSQHSLFVVVKHPAARGLGSDYFHAVGRSIKLALAEKLSP